MVVPAGELNLIRRDLEATLTDRCTIRRDANAGAAESAPGYPAEPDYQDAATAVPCRFTDVSASPKRVTTDRDVTTHEWHLLVPAATDVTDADRIASVTDQRGTVIHAGEMSILLVVSHPTHKRLILSEVS